MAKDAIEASYPTERFVGSGTMALSEEAWDRVRSRLRHTLHEIGHAATDQASRPNRVYSFTLAAFPISLYSDSSLDPRELDE